jgi:pyruvate formate lyase activating enzyme
MGPDVPLHLSRFYPQYKFSHLPPTPVETLLRAREAAKKEGVHYVYVGNVPGKGYEDTVCPRCGTTVIGRVGYDITAWHLDESSHCRHCGEPIPIVGKRERHDAALH